MATTTALSWAVLAIGLKYALHFASPGTIAWIRMLIAFSSLAVFFAFHTPQHLKVLWRPPLLGVLGALGLAANFWGFMKGVELTNASNAQIMIQLGPLSLILIGIFYFREIPTRLQLIGFTLAGVGFMFFFWDQIRIALTEKEKFLLGDLWIIFAAITWAFFTTAQKILFQRYPPQQLNLLVYAVATLALLPTAQLNELFVLDAFQWFIIVLLGLNTLIAYGALAEALKRIPASQTSLIITCNPLLTILIMSYLTYLQVSWIKPEPIEWRGFIGAFLVIGGVILAVQKPEKAKKS